MPQTRQNLHNFGRVFWKAQAIDPLQNGKALRKRAFLVQLDGAMQAHDLRTRHAGAAIFIDFHLVVPGGTTVFQSHEICDQIEESLKNHLGHVDKWRSQRRMDVMSTKPRKLSAVLS
jgi:divalent metal cation (Fe/Co/Zn/Cd) transporter